MSLVHGFICFARGRVKKLCHWVGALLIGLPPVPLLAGRPIFWPLCPTSSHQPRRNANCPAFWWHLVELVVHGHYITVSQENLARNTHVHTQNWSICMPKEHCIKFGPHSPTSHGKGANEWGRSDIDARISRKRWEIRRRSLNGGLIGKHPWGCRLASSDLSSDERWPWRAKGHSRQFAKYRSTILALAELLFTEAETGEPLIGRQNTQECTKYNITLLSFNEHRPVAKVTLDLMHKGRPKIVIET